MSFLEETPKTQCSSKTYILLTRLPLGLKRSLHTNLEPPPTTGGLHLQALPCPPPFLEPARRHHKTRLRLAQALKRSLKRFSGSSNGKVWASSKTCPKSTWKNSSHKLCYLVCQWLSACIIAPKMVQKWTSWKVLNSTVVATISLFGQTCTADKSMTASLVAKVTVATGFAYILKTQTTFKSLHLTSTFDLCIGIE